MGFLKRKVLNFCGIKVFLKKIILACNVILQTYSLLDNAPNNLVGCVIQKRTAQSYYFFILAHST